MNHLKTYQLFESIYMDYDAIDDIKDILSEFSDDDINVNIDVRPDGNTIIKLDTHDSIGTSPDRLDKIEMDVYGDCLLRLIDYLKERNYLLVTFTNTSDNQEKVYNGFSGKYKDSTIEYLMNIPKSSQIRLYFVHK